MNQIPFSIYTIKKYALKLSIFSETCNPQAIIDSIKTLNPLTKGSTLNELIQTLGIGEINEKKIKNIHFTYASYLHNEATTEHPNGMITREQAIQNSNIDSDEERLTKAKQLLGLSKLENNQTTAVINAHKLYEGIPFILLTAKQRAEKKDILVQGGFTKNQADQLIYNIICGSKIHNTILIGLILILSAGLRYTDRGTHIEKISQLRSKNEQLTEKSNNTSDKNEADKNENTGGNSGDLPVEEPKIDTISNTASGTLSTYGGMEETDLTSFYNLHQIKGLELNPYTQKFSVPNSGIQSITLQNHPRVNFVQFGFSKKNFSNEVEYTRLDRIEVNKETGGKRVISRKLHFKFTKPLSIQEKDISPNTTEIDRSESLLQHGKKLFGGGSEEEKALEPFYTQMYKTATIQGTNEVTKYLSKNHPRVARSVLENMIALFIENVNIANGTETPTELIVEFGLYTGEWYICKRQINGETSYQLKGVTSLDQATKSEFENMLGGDITVVSGKVKAIRN